MLSSAATATSVSARSGDILCGLFRKKSVAPFRFTQPVYRTSLCPSFVAVRAMAESQTAQRNQPQSSGSSGEKQALISLSDKRDLASLGNGLQELGYTIVSTGGTASTLENAGVSVTKVEKLTHFPEMLDGRVKTLHPNIHGGILARRDVEHHMEALNEHGIGTFDVVVVNLYPFYEKVTAPGGISFEDGIENIDIGGPAMIRAAAKNHKDVLIVVDSGDYQAVLEYLKGGQSDQQFRRKLAWKAFQHVAAYDSAVSEWLWKQTERKEKFPPSFTVPLVLKSSLRYGENPHQKAAFYVDKSLAEVNAGGIATAIQHHGKEMSYNNYLDADAAWNCVSEFENPTCVVVKHTNPCGVASRDDILEAYRLAVKADPVSAFGGIVAFNVEVDEVLAREIREFRSPTDGETRMFYEIVVAPKYTAKGLEVLKGKSKTLRILEAKKNDQGKLSLRQVGGGWLAQDSDDLTPEDISFNSVSDKTPTESELADSKFAWLCVKHVKSNAIVIAKNNCMLGMGSGQPNRVESLRIAFKKAGEEAKGAALATWKDAVEEACQMGIGVIAEPGGSIRDQDAIDCCKNEKVDDSVERDQRWRQGKWWWRKWEEDLQLRAASRSILSSSYFLARSPLSLYVEFTVSNFQSLVIKVPATLNFQAAPAGTDVGDSISCEFTIGDGCTAVITTQSSTKVYKAIGSKCSEQILEARIGSEALLVVIPDPVTCFSTARYYQKQIFRLLSDSNLVLVDWITSGRHANGEKWDFEFYKSINNVYLEDDHPLFLDTVLLEKRSIQSIAERMQDYQAIAMVILFGAKLKEIQKQVQENVKNMMSEQLQLSYSSRRHKSESSSRNRFMKPEFIASCSTFGPEGKGVVVRIASDSTESVYNFLRQQLAELEPVLGYVENKENEEALNVFSKMLRDGSVKPNVGTYVSILSACSDLAGLVEGQQIHQLISKSVHQKNEIVTSALLNMYSKSGELIAARKMFDNGLVCQRDLISWNSMIAVYAHHGHGKEAIEMYNQMRKHGFKPSAVTYLNLLFACSHAGLVEKGMEFFKDLVRDESLPLREEHYTCLVDLCGRAGRLKDVTNFINCDDARLSRSFYGAILSACNVHNEVSIAKEVVKKVLETGSDDAGTYVLMSNIYAANGKREEAAEMRMKMKEKGLKKQPGCSWVKVGKQNHLFVVGDKSHPQFEALDSILSDLRNKMRKNKNVTSDAEEAEFLVI
ncbi:unnamed protein product [Arabidopsis thaliana]|uniref:(thale cress) hypothetical protein n=1 Tax=Arabidopsis thaliana TaxID=3702 RepID=A0A7G2EHA6_ARATH|nr:unnamed protein product [Arabidopsis thaliana]